MAHRRGRATATPAAPLRMPVHRSTGHSRHRSNSARTGWRSLTEPAHDGTPITTRLLRTAPRRLDRRESDLTESTRPCGRFPVKSAGFDRVKVTSRCALESHDRAGSFVLPTVRGRTRHTRSRTARLHDASAIHQLAEHRTHTSQLDPADWPRRCDLEAPSALRSPWSRAPREGRPSNDGVTTLAPTARGSRHDRATTARRRVGNPPQADRVHPPTFRGLAPGPRLLSVRHARVWSDPTGESERGRSLVGQHPTVRTTAGGHT